MRICVVGPEGSGTKFVGRSLMRHPDVVEGVHISSPSGPSRHIPNGSVVWNASGQMTTQDLSKRWPGIVEDEPVGSTKHNTRFLNLSAIDMGPDGRFVICCRDQKHSRASQKRRGFDKIHVTPPDVEYQRLRIQEHINDLKHPFVLVSYETMVQWRHHYFRGVLRVLGLDEAAMPYHEVEYIDGNAKYELKGD